MKPSFLLRPFAFPVRLLGRVLSWFFGSLSLAWSAPPWLRAMGRHPRTVLAFLLILSSSGYGGFRWWQWRNSHRSQPRPLVAVRTVEPSVQAPSAPHWDVPSGKLNTPLVDIYFDKDAAPLELLNKAGAAAGPNLEPAWPGRWTWTSARCLDFWPDQPLPAGRKFKVRLAPAALAPHTVLAKDTVEFTTPALTARWTNSEFYTDPSNPATHQAVFKVEFNQPVAAEELARHVKVDAIGGDSLFTEKAAPEIIAEGKSFTTYTIRSPKIKVPEREDFARVTLTKGLAAMNGGEAFPADATEKLTVPTRDSGFRIVSAHTQIVPDDDGEPQQFLFLEARGVAEPATIGRALEAWSLPPKKHAAKAKADATEEEDDGSAWVVSDVTPAVLKKARPVKPDVVEQDGDAPFVKVFAFRLPPTAPGPMFVRLPKGTPAPGGFALGADFQEIVDVPVFPKLAKITGEGGVLALNGERKLSIKSRGYAHLRFTLARVPAGQINHLVSQARGTFEDPSFYGRFGFEEIARYRSVVQSVASRNDYEANYTAFDFAPTMAQADASDPDPSRGLFYVRVEGVRHRAAEDGAADEDDPDPDWIELDAAGNDVAWDSRAETGENGAADHRFVLVTDLGMLVKQNADGTREVFAQSFRDRGPVAGVRITALALNGEPLAEVTTGPDGHASLPALDGLKRERKPAALVARKGSDLAYLPWARDDRQVEYSRFEIGGVNASEATALDAFLFTERGIYRPGDSIHLAAMVRTRDWNGKVGGLPVEAVVYNPKEEEVGRFPAQLPPDGFLDFTIPVSESAPTGVWRLDLYKATGGKVKKHRGEEEEGENESAHLGHTLVRVEEFQPDRMKMATTFEPKPVAGWLKPDQLAVKVELKTLFDMAAADRRVTAKMHVSPGHADFSPWPKWTFHLPQAKDFEGRDVDLGEEKSDAEGKVSFALDLKSYTAPLLRVGLDIEGFEPDGGRGVRGGLSALVSAQDRLLGWHAEGDLNYVRRDVPRTVQLVAVGPDLKPVAVEHLQRVLIETRHVSVLTKQENGSMAYVSREKDKELEVAEATLPAGPSDVPLPVDRAGRFRYEWRDAEHTVLCAFAFNVVGPGGPDRSLERDTELEMTLPDREWHPGDSLEISLRAPYTGAGLITIEREKVLAWQWFTADSASSVQHITIPEGLEGGAYVNVAFVRGLNSPEIFTNPLSVGVQPFKVALDRRQMAVELDVPERVRPGEPVHIGFRTPRPGRVVIWAVDDGIHRVTSYRPPAPLELFYRQRALEVKSWQLLDLLLPEYSLLKQSRAFGGDGDEPPELKLGLNPFKRRRAAPVVFWSGIVECGPQLHEVTYDVPDYFAGRLNILAAVVGSDAVGVTEKHTTVKGPFVLTPNVPFFAVPGDEFVASLTVANQLEGEGAPQQIEVKAIPNDRLEILDAPKDPVAIAPNTDATVRFRVRAKAALGNAELHFSATAGNEHVELSSTLSIRPASPYETEVHSGWFRQPVQVVPVSRQMHPEFARLEASLSPTPYGFAHGLEAYLRKYPYGCCEQVTSKAMPWLVLKDEADFGLDPAESQRVIADTFAILASRQRPDGGFGYWTARDGTDGLDFITIYVTHFLTEARASGFNVPDSLMSGALRRMKAMAAAKVTSRSDANLQAAAIYLLTRGGEVTTNYALNLTDTLDHLAKNEWHGDLSAAWLAATWSLLKKEPEAEALMRSHLQAHAKRAWRTDSAYFYDSSLVEAAESFTIVCRHFPKIAGTLGYEDLKPLTEGIAQGDFNTLSAAWSILALKGYAGLVKQTGIQLGVEEMTGAGNRALGAVGASPFHGPFSAEAKSLRFLLSVPKGGPDLGAWYQTIEGGFAKEPPTVAQTSGLEVYREFVDEHDKPLSSAKVGDTLKLKVHLRNVNGKRQSHLAVIDLLPCGFDNAPGAVNPGLGSLGAEYVDVREDRNLLFTSLAPGESRSFEWNVRPTCAGSFVVPPAYAEAMYDRAIHGHGAAGKFTVLVRE